MRRILASFRRLALYHKHVHFRKSTPLGHLVAVMEVGGVLVAAVCAEGELQAGLLRTLYKILIGDVR